MHTDPAANPLHVVRSELTFSVPLYDGQDAEATRKMVNAAVALVSAMGADKVTPERVRAGVKLLGQLRELVLAIDSDVKAGNGRFRQWDADAIAHRLRLFLKEFPDIARAAGFDATKA